MPINSDKNVRKIVTIRKEMWAEIEDYRFDNRIKTESAAMRELIDAGLKAAKSKKKPQK